MSDFTQLITESYNKKSEQIDKMSAREIVELINGEDKTVAFAVEKALDKIGEATQAAADVLKAGGRMYYIGAGTSGRLGVLDASECPPTYGVSADTVNGIIAGGRKAAFESVEYAEDDFDSCVSQMKEKNFCANDICIGISASGSANCVKGALRYAHELGAKTVSVSCNLNSDLIPLADIPIAVDVGPEVINGSTRMKAGTAQKMILNMISTGAMVLAGRTNGNYMAYMQPTNNKLRDRAIRIICDKTGADPQKAKEELAAVNNDIEKAIENIEKNK